MDAAKNAASGVQNTLESTGNYVSDKFQESTAGASKEANKNVAKDSNASVTDRASAGMDALKDKSDESKSGASASVNKESAKH